MCFLVQFIFFDIFHSMQSWMCVLKAWTTVKMLKLSNNKTDSCLSPQIFISDGFQSMQHRSTFATFFDYSRGYDHAWETCLHMKISKICVLRRFTEWLSYCFTNHTARVCVNVSIGHSIAFNVSLPMGSVLSSNFSLST